MSGRGSAFWEGEVAKKTEKARKKTTFGQKVRGFNILFPWFKVVATMMVGLVVVFAVWGVVRHRGAEAVDEDAVAEEVAEEEIEEKDGELRVATRKGVAYAMTKPTNLLASEMKDKKLIALTFDDGPAPATTLRLLDILKEKKAKATFFVVGKMAQAAPEILQRIEQAGHVVGSHTMGHVNLTTLDVTAIKQDVATIDGVFRRNLGHAAKLTRPPYGEINDNVKAGVGQPLVIWSIDPEDWRTKDAVAIRKHVVERAFDGGIVLMHDIYDSTVDAVGGMIDDLRKAGYELVTVPEMAQARGVTMVKGEVYGSFRP